MDPDLGLRLGKDRTVGFAGAGPTFRDVEKCFLLVNEFFLPPGKPLEPLKGFGYTPGARVYKLKPFENFNN